MRAALGAAALLIAVMFGMLAWMWWDTRHDRRDYRSRND